MVEINRQYEEETVEFINSAVKRLVKIEQKGNEMTALISTTRNVLTVLYKVMIRD